MVVKKLRGRGREAEQLCETFWNCMEKASLVCFSLILNELLLICNLLTPVFAEYHCLFVRRNIQWLVRFEFSFRKMVEHVGHVIVGLSM